MLKTSPSLQSYLNYFSIRKALASLTLGIAWATSAGMPATAIPVIVQSPSCSTVVLGSPITSPVPRNTVTGEPCSFSSTVPFTTPVGVIQNSILINPTIINSRISDSVLVNPVIINSPRYPYGTVGRSTVIYNSPGSIRIRVGQ